MLLVILVMIVTNKTFSPQYMIWLGGPHAAGFALLGRRPPNTEGYSVERRRLWVISLFILTCTVLTGIVFPIGYDPLVRDSGWAGWFRLPVSSRAQPRNDRRWRKRARRVSSCGSSPPAADAKRTASPACR